MYRVNNFQVLEYILSIIIVSFHFMQPLNDGLIRQSQEEVRCILKILENQSYACNNVQALQVLRKQLTSLCTELSMHLAGVTPKRGHDPSTCIPLDTANSKRLRLQ